MKGSNTRNSAKYMNTPDENYVFHGSHELFDVVVPKRQIRKNLNKETGEYETVFDDISFHATPYKWIAIAYICTHNKFEREGFWYHYTKGVNLKEYEEVVEVDSMEESMKELYGDGGYLYTYDKNEFHHAEGLGMLELITKGSIRPIQVERIDDPVAELKKLGIEFTFTDMTKDDFYKSNMH